MKRIFCLFLTIVFLTGLAACSQSVEEQWQEQYDLGVRYLSEGNYEEAIIAFTAAIEIDPKQAETYIHLSEAYEAHDYLEDAISTLELGLDNTGDGNFLELIEAFLDKHNQLLLTEEIVNIDDFKINGVPIRTCTIADFQAAYPSAPEENWYYESLTDYEERGESGIRYRPRVKISDTSFGDWGFWTWAKSYDATVEAAVFDADSYPPPIDFRGIVWGDSLEAVLNKFGFSEHGVQFLSNEQYININVTDTGEWNISRMEIDNWETTNMTELDIFWQESDCWFMIQFENNSLMHIQYSKIN